MSVGKPGASLRLVMSPSPLENFGTFFSTATPIMSPLAEVQTTLGYPLMPLNDPSTETSLLPQPESNRDPAQRMKMGLEKIGEYRVRGDASHSANRDNGTRGGGGIKMSAHSDLGKASKPYNRTPQLSRRCQQSDLVDGFSLLSQQFTQRRTTYC